MAKKQKPPELKVVFDTNAIFTDSAAFLLKQEVSELIRANSAHADVRIRWFLPEIVRHEREYQMQQNGIALLPSVQKIERVLGHNLNITESIISERVRHLIDDQLQGLGIDVLTLDLTLVDWARVIKDSAYRIPPFQRGDKEKGFRDTLILESFVQLVNQSPTTPRRCRIVLVTGDEPLALAVKNRTKDASNVRILPSLDELKGLINTLVAEVGEDFVAKIQDAAAKYFFQKGNEETLFFREKVGQRIREKFDGGLAALPQGADGKNLEAVWIGTTRFSKKEAQRVYWVTRITHEFKAYRFQSPAPASYLGPQQLSGQQPYPLPSTSIGVTGAYQTAPLQTFSSGTVPTYNQTYIYSQGVLQSDPSDPISIIAFPHEKIFLKRGQIVFDVTWSVTVTAQRHNFSAGKVESLEFIETNWEDNP